MTRLVVMLGADADGRAVERLRSNEGVDVAVVTSALAATRDASADTVALEERLEAVLAAARGHETSLAEGDPAWNVVDQVAQSDGIVAVAGPSQLTREGLYEFSALAGLAAQFGKPLVASGLRLPQFAAPADEKQLAVVAQTAVKVGVASVASGDVVSRLVPGVALVVEARASATPVAPSAPARTKAGSFVVVGLPSNLGEDDLAEFASFLEHLARTSGKAVFLAAESGDVDATQKLVAGLSTAAGSKAVLVEAAAVAGAISAAGLLVSGSPSHIAVAIDAGVPVVGLAVDPASYSDVVGLLAGAGLGQWALPGLSLATGDAAAVADEAWERRPEIVAHLDGVAAAGALWNSKWTESLETLFAGGRTDDLQSWRVTEFEHVDARLAARIARIGTHVASLGNTVAILRRETDAARADASEQRARADILERREADLVSDLSSLRRRVDAIALGNASQVALATTLPVEDDRADLEAERDTLLLEREALEQQLFERERYSAFLGRQVHELRALLHTTVNNLPPDRSAEAEGAHAAVKLMQERIAELELQVDGLLGSTSWRASVPLRVAKNPRPYFRKFRGR